MHTKTILCVDDDLTILKAMRSLFTTYLGKGHDVQIAESGEEALEVLHAMQARDEPLAVVISDFLMPHMRGDELLLRIHEISPHTVKMMLTGQSDFEGVKRVISAVNLYRFIEKPFNNADMLLTVKGAVEHFDRDHLQLQRLSELEQEVKELRRQLAEKSS